MSYIYTKEDYNGRVDTNYRKYSYFYERANLLSKEHSEYKDYTTLIAGCAYGFLLEELDKQGWKDVWGVEASKYAVNEASPSILESHLSEKVLLGDITKSSDMDYVKSKIGKPMFIITEDVLPCAKNEEQVHIMLNELRNILQDEEVMCHFITPKIDNKEQVEGFLWFSYEKWKDLINAEEKIYSASLNKEVF